MDTRRRNWTFVVYPDSAPENWMDILAEQGIPAYVSPLHDKDMDANGEVKKAHWHVVVAFRGKKSETQVQEISNLFSGVKVQSVHDLRGIARYLCHLDNPDKYQYEVSDVRSFGGEDYLELIGSLADADNALREIMAWCIENEIDSFYELSTFAAQEKPDWFRVISSKRTVFLSSWLKSKKWTEDQYLSGRSKKPGFIDKCE